MSAMLPLVRWRRIDQCATVREAVYAYLLDSRFPVVGYVRSLLQASAHSVYILHTVGRVRIVFTHIHRLRSRVAALHHLVQKIEICSIRMNMHWRTLIMYFFRSFQTSVGAVHIRAISFTDVDEIRSSPEHHNSLVMHLCA